MPEAIHVAAVVFTDSQGRFLAVRKRGTKRFMLPGGKPEPGEPMVATGRREVEEELSIRVEEAELRTVGLWVTEAANEVGHVLYAEVFHYVGPAERVRPHAANEIEEWCWVDLADAGQLDLAPMVEDHLRGYLTGLRHGR